MAKTTRKIQVKGLLQFPHLKKPSYNEQYGTYKYQCQVLMDKKDPQCKEVFNAIKEVIQSESKQPELDMAIARNKKFMDGDTGKHANYQNNHGKFIVSAGSSAQPKLAVVGEGGTISFDDGSAFSPFGDEVAAEIVITYIKQYEKLFIGLNAVLLLKKSDYEALDTGSLKQQSMDSLIQNFGFGNKSARPAQAPPVKEVQTEQSVAPPKTRRKASPAKAKAKTFAQLDAEAAKKSSQPAPKVQSFDDLDEGDGQSIQAKAKDIFSL